MSVPNAATSIQLRSLVPSAAAAPPSGVAVRWLLRLATVVVFSTATLTGVVVALAAPSESPASISEPRR